MTTEQTIRTEDTPVIKLAPAAETTVLSEIIREKFFQKPEHYGNPYVTSFYIGDVPFQGIPVLKLMTQTIVHLRDSDDTVMVEIIGPLSTESVVVWVKEDGTVVDSVLETYMGKNLGDILEEEFNPGVSLRGKEEIRKFIETRKPDMFKVDPTKSDKENDMVESELTLYITDLDAALEAWHTDRTLLALQKEDLGRGMSANTTYMDDALFAGEGSIFDNEDEPLLQNPNEGMDVQELLDHAVKNDDVNAFIAATHEVKPIDPEA